MQYTDFQKYLFQRIETYFPCENPESLYNSMLSLAKEQNPSSSPELIENMVIFGLIKEFQDHTLDYLYHFYSATNSEILTKAA